jgi:uncharacterized protein YdeI (BOF family)
MKRFLFPILTAAILLGSAMAAYAVSMSITEVKAATAGTVVTVTGEITAADGNDYTISDGVDTISLGFGPIWYKAMGLTVGETVTVVGELDTGKDGTKAPEIDGFTATKADGTVITARTGPGKPPWAGKGGAKGAGKAGTPEVDDADDAPGSEVADQD